MTTPAAGRAGRTYNGRVSKRRLGILCLVLAASAGVASASPGEGLGRPRVCLVLSGGGALGIAHVGVLEVLEELRVPVDCVAGTSMGAIVGGLYAAGYSPAELRELALTTPWSRLLADTPERRRLPFRRKVDDLTYLTRWEFGFRGGKLRFPSGLVAGHRLGALLNVLTVGAVDIRDFDDLPVPFRAVAADIGTGETVILRGGSLARALRASMAVPGLFSPVEMDGRLLVDGGVVANLPVEAAREMGGEVSIAVDLGQPLAEQGRPESIASILSRASAFLTRLNVERVLPQVDVLVRPQVAEYGMLSFSAAEELLRRGRAAASERADALAALALPEEEWREYVASRGKMPTSIQVAAVTVDPGPGLAPQAVTRAVHTRPGGELDLRLLQEDLDRLWQLGEFEAVEASFERHEDGHVVALTGRRKSWGPNFLRFGVSLASDLEGSSQFSLLGAMTMTRLNRQGGELKVAGQLGEDPLVSGEIYQPVGTSRALFGAVTLQSSQTKQQVPLAAGPEQYRIWRQRAAVDLGVSLGRYGEVRLGLRRDSTDARPTARRHLPTFERVDAGARVSLVIDQVDSVNFPRRGVLFYGELYDASPALGADEEYRHGEAQLVTAGSLGRHTLLAMASGWSALGGRLPPEQRSSLGGLFRLSGLPVGELTGDAGGVAALVYLYQLGRLPALGGGVYAGLSVETGDAWLAGARPDLADWRRSAAAVFGADTALGPLYLAYGVTSGGKDSFYLYLGRRF